MKKWKVEDSTIPYIQVKNNNHTQYQQEIDLDSNEGSKFEKSVLNAVTRPPNIGTEDGPDGSG